MSTVSRDAVSTVLLREGFTRLTGVTYDEYVRHRDDPAYDGTRMAYLDGVLEIMSPEFRHEKGGCRVADVVSAYCDGFGIVYDEAASTTFRRGTSGEPEGAGNEPDESFYLRDAATAVAGKETLDLAVDDPPSLWIEVGNTTSSTPREALHARLKAPEVWRYRVREHALRFGRLIGEENEEIQASVALPGLTPAMVLEALAHGRTLPASEFRRWLREVWFPGLRQELLDTGAGR
jgi:Uma2 family endonuclease